MDMYSAMVSVMDESAGNLTETLRELGMWEDIGGDAGKEMWRGLAWMNCINAYELDARKAVNPPSQAELL